MKGMKAIEARKIVAILRQDCKNEPYPHRVSICIVATTH